MSSDGHYGEDSNDALSNIASNLLRGLLKDGMKFSHLRDDGHYCGTVAFVYDEERDAVTYGISIASLDERKVTYEKGKKISIARCLSGQELEWRGYYGHKEPNVRIIRLEISGLKKAGTLPASKFFKKLKKLRKYM